MRVHARMRVCMCVCVCVCVCVLLSSKVEVTGIKKFSSPCSSLQDCFLAGASVYQTFSKMNCKGEVENDVKRKKSHSGIHTSQI